MLYREKARGEWIGPGLGFASLVYQENTSMPPMRAACDSRMMYKKSDYGQGVRESRQRLNELTL